MPEAVSRSLAIPMVMHAYNIYNNKNKALQGMESEVTLPDLEMMTETISGAGIAGEVEEVIMGFLSSMEMEIDWNIMYGDFFDSIYIGQPADLTLRASNQVLNKATGEMVESAQRVVVRGRTKKIEGGTAKQGGKSEPKTTYEMTYIKIEQDGETKLEADKYNFIFSVNGHDYLADVRKNI